jgi:hypothetical protein
MAENKYPYQLLKNEDSDAESSTICTNERDTTLVWLDDDALDTTSPNYRVTVDMLKKIHSVKYKLYNSSALFMAEIEQMTKTTEVIVIISGQLAETTIPRLTVSLLRELSSIFIFCQNYDDHKYFLKKCRKISDICTDHQSLEEAIRHEIHPPANAVIQARNLKPMFILKEDPEGFLLYQLNIELLKHYRWTTNNREKMLDECMNYYSKNRMKKREIRRFKAEYESDKAIQWYTKDSFLYRLVNKALRSLDMEEINIFRPYIKDLCKQLEQLYNQQRSDRSLIVYRGHAHMPIHHLGKIKNNIGSLVSFNGFLSTTTNYDVAVIYAGLTSAQQVSIIFEIQTNYNFKNVIFADISEVSNMQDEEEILFSLCSVFRIHSVEEDTQENLWKIVLIATDEDILNLREYINQRVELHERPTIDGPIHSQSNLQINDQSRVEVIETNNYPKNCINRYLRCNFTVAMCVILFIITATVVLVFLGIKTQSKHQISNSYNCEGINCTTRSTNTGNVH